RDLAEAHVEALRAEGRVAMVQPYQVRIDTEGETSLVFLDGTYSHAIRKAPLLSRDHAAVAGLFAAERFSTRAPGPDELALGRRAVDATPGGRPLYARVDVVRDDAGAPRVLEL